MKSQGPFTESQIIVPKETLKISTPGSLLPRLFYAMSAATGKHSNRFNKWEHPVFSWINYGDACPSTEH